MLDRTCTYVYSRYQRIASVNVRLQIKPHQRPGVDMPSPSHVAVFECEKSEAVFGSVVTMRSSKDIDSNHSELQ
jgi:hypothetical protein